MSQPEVVAHWNLSDMQVCLSCHQACLASRTACPSCTGNKLVPLADLKRTIIGWAEEKEARK